MFGRSDHHQASLRKVADERIKKADERHKLILKERQEKAAKNAARIKKAEKRKVGKRVFTMVTFTMVKMIILPRQARDKDGKVEKRVWRFPTGAA